MTEQETIVTETNSGQLAAPEAAEVKKFEQVTQFEATQPAAVDNPDTGLPTPSAATDGEHGVGASETGGGK